MNPESSESASGYVCRVKTVTPLRFAAIRTQSTPEQLGSTLEQSFGAVWEYLNSLESVTVGPAIARYHLFAAETIDCEAGFPVEEEVAVRAPIAISNLPGGRAATTIHYGPYSSLPAAYAALQAWLEREGLHPDRGPYEIYWADPGQIEDESELRTEVVWPLRE